VDRARTLNERLLSADELGLRLVEFYRALEEFNDGYYFEAHETLEDLWRVTPMPERLFFQGVIQLAAAFVHVARGERAGALKLLDAAADKLRGFVPESLGVDVAAVMAAIAEVRRALAAAKGDDAVCRVSGLAPRFRFARAT